MKLTKDSIASPPLRTHPHLYQAHAQVFLNRISRKYGRSFSLSTIPDEEWQRLAKRGFDIIWLMGVWKRSPEGREIALKEPHLRRAFDLCLPDWKEGDVAGSPYAIFDYSLDQRLGQGNHELRLLKEKLHNHRLRLMLDFVPNHLALDHPWTKRFPVWFIVGSDESVSQHPDWFYQSSKGKWLAHGRDPYFPPWTDTVQVNFFSSDLRQALIGELEKIAELCDGVRCDMAMLALNDTFASVWKICLKDPPKQPLEFWTEAISAVRARNPDFLFMAEVYWNLEKKLLDLGFDYAYDKILYDQLLHGDIQAMKTHLQTAMVLQSQWAHFIENHDEQRSMTAFGPERVKAAAAIIATLPGLRFFHEGQFEGRQIKLPIHLAREASEVAREDVRKFYDALLDYANQEPCHQGNWFPVLHHAASVFSWYWTMSRCVQWVVVNYSDSMSQAEFDFSRSELKGMNFVDCLSGKTYHGKSSIFRLTFKPWEILLLRNQ